MSAPTMHRAVRAGTEPHTDRSARELKLRLSALTTAVFLVLSGLLAWGASATDYGDTQNVIAVMSTVCFVGFCAALVSTVRLVLRQRRERRPLATSTTP